MLVEREVCQDVKVGRVDVKRCYLHSIHRMQPFVFFHFLFLKMKHYFYTNININCTYKTPEGMNVRNI